MSRNTFASDLGVLLEDVDPKSALMSLHFAARIATHRTQSKAAVPWAAGVAGEPSDEERQLAGQIIKTAEKAYAVKITEWDAKLVSDVAQMLLERSMAVAVAMSGRSSRGVHAFRNRCLALDSERFESRLSPRVLPKYEGWWHAPLQINRPTVFISYRQDDAAALELAAVLEKLSASSLILRDHPNSGRSVVETLEELIARVTFAIVLFTADDIPSKDSSSGPARHNVIFELGYLVGRLGRERVCVLAEPGVELPSDYSGLIFYFKDPAGAWKRKLANELLLAGVDSDIDGK